MKKKKAVKITNNKLLPSVIVNESGNKPVNLSVIIMCRICRI